MSLGLPCPSIPLPPSTPTLRGTRPRPRPSGASSNEIRLSYVVTSASQELQRGPARLILPSSITNLNLMAVDLPPQEAHRTAQLHIHIFTRHFRWPQQPTPSRRQYYSRGVFLTPSHPDEPILRRTHTSVECFKDTRLRRRTAQSIISLCPAGPFFFVLFPSNCNTQGHM